MRAVLWVLPESVRSASGRVLGLVGEFNVFPLAETRA